MPLKSIAQYRRDLTPGKRVHVKGALPLQRPGEDFFFLQDETADCTCAARQPELLTAREVVEVVGFATSTIFCRAGGRRFSPNR